ncbi:MAG TPA: endonuclease/exonuclease/phosphatase family protein [Pyrinomonadaceae bacterium]|nr:endonuclease/exonuclease/phosphatase family protein [Pyrinomonadaceae bacterium]
MALLEQSAHSLPEPAPLEFGNVPARRKTEADTKLVIASYNIRYAVGRYLISTGLLRKAGLFKSRNRSGQVAANIRAAARTFLEATKLPPVDILALQEADKGTARAGGHHVAQALAEELNMSWVHAAAGIPRGIKPQPRQWWLDFEEQIGLYDQGDTGVALLSHLPLEDVRRIDLPWKDCPWRPRLSISATVRAGERALQIFNAHIDPHSSANGQIEQLQVMLDEAENSSLPAVMLGDFNTLSGRKCVETRGLLESRGYTTPFSTGTSTWRGAGLRLHADWVFVRGLTVTRWGVVRPLNVSDHWPIWVEIDFSRKEVSDT